MIQEIKLSKIQLNNGQIEGVPKNPRFVKDEKFDKLKKSIIDDPEMLALRELIVVPYNDKFICIAGNMRLRALRELKYEKAICKVIDFDAKKLRAIATKDNLPYGEWDWEVLGNDWDFKELEEWGFDFHIITDDEEKKNEAKDDDYDEPENIQVDVVVGDLIEIGNHRLLCGSSTEINNWEKIMNGELCDLVITDPPYNVDYTGKTKDSLKIQNDKKTNDEFYHFLFEFYTSLAYYTKSGGAWYVWHADSEGANFRQAMKDAGIMVKQCLIWVKQSMVLGRQDYQWRHEPCLYGWKEGAAHKWYSDRKQTTVLEFNRPSRNAEHPTMKPIPLISYQINNSSKEGDLVCDGFLGSGSTMVAAHQINRICYGMELDPRYCQVIIDRMLKLDPKLEVKINGEKY